jgi:plastocyanin
MNCRRPRLARRIAAVLAVAAALLLACLPAEAQVLLTGSASGSGISTWNGLGSQQVTITDSGFSPNPLNIPVNTVVTFVNAGSTVHIAASPVGTNPTFDTGGLAPGQEVSFQFQVAGSFPYQSNTEGDRVITNNKGIVTTVYKLMGVINVGTTAAAPTPAPAAPAPIAIMPVATLAPAPGPCQYVLGFATLAAVIPQVGQCLDSQNFAPNGDALQHTSGGLLVWRKADNWTAFTDGYRTWVNGPQGIQQRLNTARFPWEH